MNILITGSAGFFGRILSEHLAGQGYDLFGVDRIDQENGVLSNFVKMDLAVPFDPFSLFPNINFEVLIDLAAEIDFATNDQVALYNNNTRIAKNLIDFCKQRGLKKYIYTSSNSVFLGCDVETISDDDEPSPVDSYGRSKFDVERLLLQNDLAFLSNVVRCPNIIDSGRVGMLSILYELLLNDSTIWVLNKGSIRHQCIYAQDLCRLIDKLIPYQESGVFNVGSDPVPTFRELFDSLIEHAGSRSKVRSLPSFLVVPLLRILYRFGISPLGPYQFRMLSQSFIFDIGKVKRTLGWFPTKTNEQMLQTAFDYYRVYKNTLPTTSNRGQIRLGFLKILLYIKL